MFGAANGGTVRTRGSGGVGYRAADLVRELLGEPSHGLWRKI
jgi:hypothetical protein